MGQEISESDRKLLTLLPMLVNWIETNRHLADREMTAFMRQYPDHFGMAVERPLGDMFAMLAKYENHAVYGKGIQIVQSPEGRKWLENFYIQAREAAKNLK